MPISVVDLTPMHTCNSPGMAHTWLCMGCRKPRFTQGSRGAGPAKRCADCVARREARQQAAGGSRIDRLLKAVAAADSGGLDSRALAQYLGVPPTELRRLHREAVAQGHVLHTYRYGPGKGGGRLLFFRCAADRDAHARAVEARNLPPKPKGRNMGLRSTPAHQPLAEVQAAAFAIATRKETL